MSDKGTTSDDRLRISCVEQEQGQFVAVEYNSNVRGHGRSREEALGRLIIILAEMKHDLVVLNV